MTANELKNYIKENNCIISILDDLGCHKIRELSTEIRCALPGHNNANSLCIKKENLGAISYDDEITFTGDIFNLIMTLKKISFIDSLKYVCGVLKIPYTNDYHKEEVKQFSLNDFFKNKIKLVSCEYKDAKEEQMTVFNSLDTEEYIFLPHINWIREGILPCAIERFRIGYDMYSQRIIIPHRKWDGTDDEWVGITGRTTIENYDLLGLPKYMSMRKERYPKTMNVYGLQENMNDIKEKNQCVIFEAEKSVLKRYSHNDKTAVAICGHTLSKEQIRILDGLDVELTVAMDRGISQYQVRELCHKLYNNGARQVYYIWDTYDAVLKDKESPADLTNEKYNYLFKYRIKYDEIEEEKYLKERQEREQYEKN